MNDFIKQNNLENDDKLTVELMSNVLLTYDGKGIEIKKATLNQLLNFAFQLGYNKGYSEVDN